MGRKLDMSPLDDLFAKGEDFDLTDVQYEEKIKKALPKDANYIKNISPLALRAKEKGFIITSVVSEPTIRRTVKFKKVKKEN